MASTLRSGRLRRALPWCGILAAALALRGPVPAAAGTAGSWALSPVGRYQFVLVPGGTATGSVAVVNTAAAPQRLEVQASDLLPVAGGGFAPAPPGTAATGAGGWLRLGASAVTVPAGGAVHVPFTVSVPPSATPGRYDAAIVAAAPGAASGQGGMGLSTRAALAVQVAVPLADVPVLSGLASTVEAPGGAVGVTVPAGAVPAGTVLTLSPGTGGAVPAFPPLPGPAAVGPYAVGLAGASASLSPPAEAVLRLPAGTASAGLFVFEFDPALQAWLPLPTAVTGTSLVAPLDRLAGVAAAADPSLTVYPDVAGTWAEGPVLALESLGVVSGYPDGTFRPGAPVTRAELAALLARALRLPPRPASLLAAFADGAAVPSWAAQGLAAAVGGGLLRGDAAGDLDPGGPVTRAEAAVIAARALGLRPAPVAGFSDAASIPAWAVGAVGAAAQAGLMDGYPDGSFGPLEPVDRAEAAALALRLMRAAGP